MSGLARDAAAEAPPTAPCNDGAATARQSPLAYLNGPGLLHELPNPQGCWPMQEPEHSIEMTSGLRLQSGLLARPTLGIEWVAASS